jgi:hypothetical protein
VSLGRLIQARGWVAFGLAAVYIVAGAAGFVIDFDETSYRVAWLVLLGGGAAVILAGIFLADGTGWTAALLMSLGGAAGGLVLFWTFLVPVAVAALVALSITIAHRAPKTA